MCGGRSGSAVCISVPEVLTLLLRLLLLCSSSSTQKQNKRYVFCWLLGRFLWFLICSLINFYRSRIIQPNFALSSSSLFGCLPRKLSLSGRKCILFYRSCVPIGSFIYLIFSSRGIIFHCLSNTIPHTPSKHLPRCSVLGSRMMRKRFFILPLLLRLHWPPFFSESPQKRPPKHQHSSSNLLGE